MPQDVKQIAVPGKSTAQILTLSYASFKNLGWTVEFIMDNRLVGYSKKTWNTHADHIIVDVTDGELEITSKLPESAAFDLLKKNKKNTTAFENAFHQQLLQDGSLNEERFEAEMSSLREQTVHTIRKETEEAEKINEVMNLSKGSQAITYTIIGLNLLIFIMMLLSGVALFDPLVSDLVRWGANVKWRTLDGEWWRLISSVFVHIGLVHILFNMYALYMVGIYLEPMLGKGRYITAYLATGLLASVTSSWWHDENLVSAGASGAIFGLYGVFLSLLTTKLIPQSMRKAMLQSIGIFVGYNILYGAKSDATDNAAHLGGLVSGFVIGYIYYFSIKQPAKLGRTLAMSIIAATSLAITIFYLSGPADQSPRYVHAIESFQEIEMRALAPLNNDDPEKMLSEVRSISKPEWEKAKKLMEQTSGYNLNPSLARNRQLINEYIDLRIRHTGLIIRSLEGDDAANHELTAIGDSINNIITEINKTL